MLTFRRRVTSPMTSEHAATSVPSRRRPPGSQAATADRRRLGLARSPAPLLARSSSARRRRSGSLVRNLSAAGCRLPLTDGTVDDHGRCPAGGHDRHCRSGPTCNEPARLLNALPPAGAIAAFKTHRELLTYDTIRYDTIRDAILTCARKPT